MEEHADRRTAGKLLGPLVVVVIGVFVVLVLVLGVGLWWLSYNGPEAPPVQPAAAGAEVTAADIPSENPPTGNAPSENTPGTNTASASTPGTDDRAGQGDAPAAPAPAPAMASAARPEVAPPSQRQTPAVPATASLRIAWDPSLDPRVKGYRVLYGTQPGSYAGSVDVAGTTTATLTGLAPGTRYYVVVIAVDAAGDQSGPSDEIEVVTPE